MERELGYQNRIVGHGTKPASQFQAHPNNWRKHPKNQRSAVKGSLESLGWVAEVIENKTTGRLIDGHERVWNALQNGDADVPFIQVELTEAEEAQALLSLDAIAALAETDREQVDALLKQVETDNADVMQFLTDFAKDNKLDWNQPEQGDADIPIDRAAELLEKWKVETGDLWQIGSHKLLCGDSTKREDVERVMGGEKAQMCFTSPPYNQGGKAKRLPAFYAGEGDNKTKDEYFEFLINVLNSIASNMNPDAPLLWNVSYNSQSRDDYGRIIFSQDNPFHVMETIIWDKKHGFNVSARGILSRDSELIFLMCTGEDYYTNQGRYDTWYNTWRIGTNGAQTEGHGAAFPVELVEKGIVSFSPDEGFVIDPFIGTGTTMVACQNLNRKCRAIEISPAYISVILERMSQAFPGIEIHRANSDA